MIEQNETNPSFLKECGGQTDKQTTWSLLSVSLSLAAAKWICTIGLTCLQRDEDDVLARPSPRQSKARSIDSSVVVGNNDPTSRLVEVKSQFGSNDRLRNDRGFLFFFLSIISFQSRPDQDRFTVTWTLCTFWVSGMMISMAVFIQDF